MGSLSANWSGGMPMVSDNAGLDSVEIKEIKSVILQFRQVMGQIRLSDPLKTELTGDLDELESYLESSAPIWDFVRHSLVSIRYILETVPTNAQAELFAKKIVEFIGK